MTQRARFEELEPDQRRQVHFALCQDALATWTAFAQRKPRELRYRDSVVGMRHRVDVELPADALRSAYVGRDLAEVGDRYLEPLTAMQDDDLSFPDPVEFAYYSISNCFRKYVRGDDIADWLIVNQALSAHDISEVEARLRRAIDDVVQ
ncbi:hypothetical protein ACFWUP_03785 [Nocardia sp. NPDC058658]|uniref:hypothetical protein n=1 Tax=Nocardia sp. NPDC058658 TaxID=3346580 RepID=UPI003661ED5A